MNETDAAGLGPASIALPATTHSVDLTVYVEQALATDVEHPVAERPMYREGLPLVHFL